MSTPIEASSLQQAEQAILSPDGPALLKAMRRIFFGQPVTDTPAHLIEKIRQLGWAEFDHRHCPRLTALGSSIADSAREYCNWLDDDRRLPAGLTKEDVAGRRVLDVGCGFGRYLLSSSRLGAAAVGIDLHQPYLQLSRAFSRREEQPAPRVALGTAEELPFPDACFDFILCIRSFYFMDPQDTLAEFGRVLADGGRCILIVNTFLTQLKKMLTPDMMRRGLGHNLRQWRDLSKGYGYALFGQRLFRTDRTRPTGSGMHVTTRFLRRCMDNAGMTMTTCDHANSLYIATRNPRP